jgi:hypothetical protein
MSFSDVVVLLPGITGSVLANDKGQELWSPSAGAVWRAITSIGGSIYAAEMHGSLQNADGALANLKGVLTRRSIDLDRFRAELPTALTLDLDDVVLEGESLRVRVRANDGRPTVTAHLTHSVDNTQLQEVLRRSREPGWQELELDLAPGVWKVRVDADGASPVTDLAVVAES